MGAFASFARCLAITEEEAVGTRADQEDGETRLHEEHRDVDPECERGREHVREVHHGLVAGVHAASYLPLISVPILAG